LFLVQFVDSLLVLFQMLAQHGIPSPLPALRAAGATEERADGTELTILSDYISIYTGPGSGTSDLVYVSENFLYESGYSAYSQSDLWRPYAAKFGRVVNLFGAYKPASKISSTSGNGVKVGTVPAGFRPLRTVTRVQNANDTVKFLLTINPSGEIWVARSTASGSAINAGAALRISCSYISST